MKKSILVLLIFLIGAGFNSSAYALQGDELLCVYTKKNFKGSKYCTSSIGSKNVNWRFYRDISSIEVKSGYELVAFRYWGNFGRSKIFSGNVERLGQWNNRIGSFDLIASTAEQDKVCFYGKPNYQGIRYCATEDQYWLGWFWNNRISSVSIPSGSSVTLYKRWGYRGKSLVLNSSAPKLGNFNNRVSSIKISALAQNQDNDGDGVFNDADKCEGTPLGVTVDANGCALAQLDSDNDGVNDAIDKCDNTPAGETVNAEGCSLTQLDSDNDGVSNALDQCPNSPEGEAVDAEGCSQTQLDADNDGVNDALDKCENTPADEAVNEEGCALSQLDSDSDGINDALDKCENTPAGEAVDTEGCSITQLDADNDGVADSLDNCENTPVGETVNAEGCALSQLDSDSDGINDALDQCGNTPAGEAVNTEGCALSQLDSDSDGVSDALDKCDNTPVGETVNAEGCALSQLDSDSDGINDALDQCGNTLAGEAVNTEGCALSQLDSDSDGVSDALDKCDNTPVGETVNAEGCALSQLDSDSDGINDALDKCGNTPAGETVNTEGCALSQLDSDNDGVNDALDKCDNTSAGETVNAEGCASSQLDSDSDGVNDALDKCDNTSAGETVNAEGCALSQLDSDNDGVNDALDKCDNTPVGETVNAEGCALSQLDSDSDGVNDALDKCGNTPAGETVNAEGCALSQLDSDNDGVNDAFDQCPNTPAGEVVGDDGCVIGQLDSDGDGVPDVRDVFPFDPNESSDLDGDGVGDNADTDRDGDGVENEQDAFPNDGDEALDTDGDGVGDNADPDRDGDGVLNEDDFFPLDPDASTVPTVEITTPATLITVGSSPLRLAGTVDDLDAKIIINGIEVDQNSGSFEADVALEEGANNIIVRAIDDKAHEGIATITVSLDKTPPYITVRSPRDGSKVFGETISVSGLVNDIVRGTVSEDEAIVRVSTLQGVVEASVSNRSYLAEGVKLQVGENQITISAADAVGNENTETLTVIYEPQVDKVIELVSGQAQEAVILESIANPLLIKLTENGQPVINKPVIFRVTEGDGLLQPGTSSEGNGAVVNTNSDGVAEVDFRLGSRAGTGNHKVKARAVGFKGEVEFYHSANYSDGIQLGIIDGNNQRGSVRLPLAKPLTLALTDAGANLIPNAEIEFVVIKGSGKFSNGETVYSTITDLDGRASASFVLGAEEGLDVQRVIAKLVGTEATAGFTLSGFMPGDPAETSISGVVLDNQDRPMSNVTIRVDGSARQAVTDDEGQFVITEAPVGPVHLFVEGSTTSREGEWPSLSYNLVTVPGVQNPMISPIYLVELDTENAVYVGVEDKVVTHPDLPGFELEVNAGSVTFPDGSKEGDLSITRVNANKIPMPPPNGMQPQLIVTLQPHGAKFDPPARLTLPNTDGYAPLAEVEMYSYDHDLEEFVTIGLGTVAKDGSVIKSNVGSGVIKAGWHCGSGPGGSGCCESPPECGYCYESNGGSCGEGTCDIVPERVAEDQVEGNCQTELCSGSEVDDNDVNTEGDVQYDCKVPGCEAGTPKDIPDDSDIDPEEECSKCEEGALVADESKDMASCGDPNDPSQACLVCKDGKCGRPDCDASDEVKTESLGENELAAKFFGKLNKLGNIHPLLKVKISSKVSGSVSIGEECCSDCTEPEAQKGTYYKLSGKLEADLKVNAGPGGSIDYEWTSSSVFGYAAQFKVNGFLEAQIKATANVSASANGKYNFDCDEGCASVNAEVDLGLGARAGGAINQLDIDILEDGDSAFEVANVEGVELSVTAELGSIGGSIGASVGPADCDAGCTYRWGPGSLTGVISGGKIELFEIYKFEMPSYTQKIELWDGGSASCG